MLRYVAHRVALGFLSLLLLSMMVYAAAQVLPGNPGRIVLGREATPAAIAREVHRLWQLNRDRIATGDPDLLIVGTRLLLR